MIVYFLVMNSKRCISRIELSVVRSKLRTCQFLWRIKKFVIWYWYLKKQPYLQLTGHLPVHWSTFVSL